MHVFNQLRTKIKIEARYIYFLLIRSDTIFLESLNHTLLLYCQTDRLFVCIHTCNSHIKTPILSHVENNILFERFPLMILDYLEGRKQIQHANNQTSLEIQQILTLVSRIPLLKITQFWFRRICDSFSQGYHFADDTILLIWSLSIFSFLSDRSSRARFL